MEKSCNACSKKINILIDNHYYLELEDKYLCFECDERPMCPVCSVKGCLLYNSEEEEEEDEETKPLIITITKNK